MADVLFDGAYLQALADRNEDVEQHLVAHFSRSVRVKLQIQLRSPELAQDASQETFLRVFNYFRSGKTLDNPASLPGFVHKVSHNIALEFLRSSTRHPQLSEDAPEPVDRAPSPEGQVVTEERKRVVQRILRDLPEKDRELLRRVFLEEEDKDAVCAELGVDRGYLRVLLYRARVRMKTAWLRLEGRQTAHGASR
ncbi:MAG TPA: sigma-70 family RNA polymerase sigma factor [Bryobacteraceae bacterium]|nr:sigma-70 family RNA polymerase sigma factor [Bryobacteraceae bacterium]